jgi:hypothetical protein
MDSALDECPPTQQAFLRILQRNIETYAVKTKTVWSRNNDQ